MPCEFFFSHANADKDVYVEKFFNDLHEQVRVSAGYPRGARVGFMDEKDLELGGEWDEELARALQESRTMVSMYSPNYFASEFCGKEWEVLQERRKIYRKQLEDAGQTNVLLPPVIKPVIWIPLRRAVPGETAAVQYTRGVRDALSNTEGMRYLCMQFKKYETEYNDFIVDLARDILSAGQTFVLPELPALRYASSAVSAFHMVPPPGGVAAAPHPDTGPDYVQFVFVAAKPNEFPAGLRSARDFYLPEGGRYWKPYFPDKPQAIRNLADNVASSDDMAFFPEELPFSPNLAQDVRTAEDNRRIVVVFVDGWTLTIQSYSQALNQFDRQNYINCGVIVPWNDLDQETQQQRALLEQAVGRTFFFRTRLRNTVYFRDAIHSQEELRRQLREVLIQLKAEVINRAEVTRPMPAGGEKPGVSGPR